jgi:hypothetical protein
VPLEVYEAMRRERWRELEYQRTGRRTLAARKLEEKTIEMAIADLFILERQASPASGMQEMQARPKQAYDIEFVQDAQNDALYHVSRYGLPWQDFHTVKRLFRQPGGRWPWEEEPESDA